MADDPRATRSRDALVEAAGRLAGRREIAELSVTELVAEAGVSRPTFYQYFADVPTAVAAAVARRIADVFARADAQYGGEARGPFVRGTGAELVAEMAGERDFYRRVLAGPSSRAASDLVIRYVGERMRERLYAGGADEAAAVRIDVIAAGITWLMVQWVGGEPIGDNAPETIASRLADLLLELLPGEMAR